uniref:Interactor of constitutive active ROPs 3 n=1 Tax=Kalanchoe fedtschenkoi TaxID=63787 RepID=A0A7N0R9G7_KALFE
MQTPKSKSYHIDGAQKTALRSSSDSVSSSLHQTTRTEKDKSPKIIERRSPRGRVNEKRSSELSDLEAYIAQLQEELKKAKDQASSSEIQKRQAQQEVEEGKRQISVISAELKETNKQLIEISSSEDDRLQELCQISQERDKAWESELEAVRKQHSLDVGALSSAMHEIQKLKKQLEMVSESEAVQAKRAEIAEGEVRKLQFELGETLTLVERLEADVRQCRESEVQAQKLLSESQRMLNTVNGSTYMIQSASSLSLKSEQSENYKAANDQITHEDKEDINQLHEEISHLQLEASRMRAALDAAEVRYQEEYIQSTLQIRSAYELVEVAKSESRMRQAELEAELEKVKSNMEELQAKQKNENEKPRLSDKENVWASELKKARASLADTKASLLEKENLLQAIAEEQEKLKLELQKSENEKAKAIKEAAAALADAEKVCESKVTHLAQEADGNSRRVAQVMEQLEAAQAASTEMEVELRRLKVQCDQWRKAAEAAAVMLTAESGKYMERSESLDSSYQTIGGHLGSPYSDDDMDDVTSKKKNGSMLQKIGVLWKKSNSNKQM